MSSLAAQGRYNEIATTIHSLEQTGFALSTKNWNRYIQILSSSHSPNDQLSAFLLCESLLMPNFPKTWALLASGRGTDPFLREDWFTKKIEKRVDEFYYPGHLQPTYFTMVYLGAAFIKFRDRTAIDGGKEMARLRKQAPKTIEALITMPRLKDRPQGLLLRGYSPASPDIPPRGGRPKFYPITRNITPAPVLHSNIKPLRRRRKNGRRAESPLSPLMQAFSDSKRQKAT
jgi:pentatricopeptide repeat-containing protein PET309